MRYEGEPAQIRRRIFRYMAAIRQVENTLGVLGTERGPRRFQDLSMDRATELADVRYAIKTRTLPTLEFRKEILTAELEKHVSGYKYEQELKLTKADIGALVIPAKEWLYSIPDYSPDVYPENQELPKFRVDMTGLTPYYTELNLLGLSARSYHALNRAGITRIRDLALMTQDEILAMDNIGVKSCNEIIDKFWQFAGRVIQMAKQQAESPS